MGRHEAPKGQPGRLPGGAPLVRNGDTTSHRQNHGRDTEPEPAAPESAERTEEHAEGWRH